MELFSENIYRVLIREALIWAKTAYYTLKFLLSDCCLPFSTAPITPFSSFISELLLILEAARSCNCVVISSYDLEISEKQVLCHFLRQNLYIEYALGISTSATLSAM